MDPPNRDIQNPSFLWDQVLTPPSVPSSSTSQPPIMSTPTLSLWSRKLAFQSEELNSLIQKSTTKLHDHQQELSGLLSTCNEDIIQAQKQLEIAASKRDNEVDTQLATLRRLTQTTTDLLHGLEAKLSLLESLHTIHHKLQSHDFIFRDLLQGQKQLLVQQEKVAAEQETQTSMLKDIHQTLCKTKQMDCHLEQEVQEPLCEKTTVKGAPLASSKRPRRLLSDEELLTDEEAGYHQVCRTGSIELLSIEESHQRGATSGFIEFGRGGGGNDCVVLERPLKRKLLSTMDVEQFATEEL